MDNNRLSDELLRQEGMQPETVSNTERQQFKTLVQDQKRQTQRHRRRLSVLGCLATLLGCVILPQWIPGWLVIVIVAVSIISIAFMLANRHYQRVQRRQRLNHLLSQAQHERSPLILHLLKHRVTQSVAAVLAVGLLLISAYVSQYHPDPQNTILVAQASLFSNSTTALRILVRDHAQQAPIANAKVRIRLRGQQLRQELGEFLTDASGCITDPVYIPDVTSGPYELVIESRSKVGKDRIVHPVEIKRPYRIYLTTDKPIYQPGQTIHMRSLALNSLTLKPFAGQPVLFEVEDPKGNKVFKESKTSSDYALAACDFNLAREVNLGRYTLRVTVGDVVSEKTVTVKHYVLPKFKVTIDTNQSFYLPGERIQGTVNARYFFGKPVQNAQVDIVGRTQVVNPTELFKLHGRTDERGLLSFSTQLSNSFVGMPLAGNNAFLEIEARVTDSAGHTEQTTYYRSVAEQPINIHVLPESARFVPGVENIIYILTAYPDGRPAICDLDINGAKQKSDQTGVAVFRTQTHTQSLDLNIRVLDQNGRSAQRRYKLEPGPSSTPFLLRTDRAVYRTGDSLQVTLLSPPSPLTFYIDVVKNGQTLLTKSISSEQGRAELALDLSPDLFGTLQLRAYTITPAGQSLSTTRIVHVHPANQLHIAGSLDKTSYRPSETAQMAIHVTDPNGQATPAALSLSAVDEAVFYVTENRAGLLEQFFLADGELLEPAYQIRFNIPTSQLLSPQPQHQTLAQALLSTSGTMPLKLEDLEEYLSPDTIEALRGDMKTGVLKQILDDPRYADLAPLLQEDGQAPTVISTQDSKVGQAEAFRKAYFYKLLIGLMMVVSVFLTLSILWKLGYCLCAVHQPESGSDTRSSNDRLSKTLKRIISSFGLLMLWPIVSYTALTILINLITPLKNTLVWAVFTSNFIVVLCLFAFQVNTSKTLALKPEICTLAYKIRLRARFMLVFYIASRLTLYLINESYIVLGILAICIVTIFVYASIHEIIRQACINLNLATSSTPKRVHEIPIVLLVIVGIFGVLMPSLSRVRQLAFRMTTGTILEGLGKAMLIYSSDYPGEIDLSRPAIRIRKYFPETLLWQPELITDEKGRARVEVPLADSITTWRMNIDALSASGQLGSREIDIPVFQSFFVDLDLPVYLTRGDEVSIPVTCYNYLQQDQSVQLTLQSGPECRIVDTPQKTVKLRPNDVQSVSFRIKAMQVGTATLTVTAQGQEMSDAMERTIPIRPDGTRVDLLENGILNNTATHIISLPAQSIPHSQQLLLKVYPSTFSEVVEGLEGIFQVPHGCFEQTSSTTYPNVLALAYMKRTGQITPEIEIKARKHINTGYQRLLTFEVEGGGFDWFGHPPANETLTAYGILEFTDMAQVHNVDRAIIDRSMSWLLSKQTVQGTWNTQRRLETIHTIHAERTHTAYITWSLAEARCQGTHMNKAFAFLSRQVKNPNDPYTLALMANAFLTENPRHSLGQNLLQQLATMLKHDGDQAYLVSPGEGALYSRGQCLDIETTALTCLAMIKGQQHPDLTLKMLTWISQQKDRFGSWHSTQATILALKALVAGSGSALTHDRAIPIAVSVNNEPAGSLTIEPDKADLVHTLRLTDFLKPGQNTIQLENSESITISYRLVGAYWIPSEEPTSTPAQELDIQVTYDRTQLNLNEKLTCQVEVRNQTSQAIPMAIIDLGIPPGFKVNPSAFEQLVKQERLAKYELTGNQCILYLRTLEPATPYRFQYELAPLYPIRAQIPPSEVYEYYRPENRDHTQAHTIEVVAP